MVPGKDNGCVGWLVAEDGGKEWTVGYIFGVELNCVPNRSVLFIQALPFNCPEESSEVSETESKIANKVFCILFTINLVVLAAEGLVLSLHSITVYSTY